MSIQSNEKRERKSEGRNHQFVIRPSSILPDLSTPTRKQFVKEAAADSGKSSRSSSKGSNANSDILDLIIYGNSIKNLNGGKQTSRTTSGASIICDDDRQMEENTVIKKTTRTNSLPGIINRRYSIETSTIRQAKHVQIVKKSGRRRGIETETKSAECVYHENLSLDLSRMSDFADSEDESFEWDKTTKQKLSKSQNQAVTRRRRSIEKDKALNNRSSQSKGLPSSSRSLFTRRSSLQNFSPRSSQFNNTVENYNPKLLVPNSNKIPDRRPSSTSVIPNINVPWNPDSIYSSASPDYTSEPSTCDTSPSKVSPQNSKLISDKRSFSSKTTTSPLSQIPCLSSSSSCYTSWMERSLESDRNRELNDTLELNVSDNTPTKERGEWNSFWRDYNSTLTMFPKKFYDDCPTPFYQEPEETNMTSIKQKSPSNSSKESKDKVINGEVPNADVDIKCLYLSKNEAKEMIHCAHRLAEILTVALEKKCEKKGTETKGIQVDFLDKYDLRRNEVKIEEPKYTEKRKGLPLVLELNEPTKTKTSEKNNVGDAQNNSISQTISHLLLSGITILPSASKDVQL